MFKSKIRMWSIVINHIPAARLEDWAWWLGVFAITLPILGGVCGWLSFEMNDTVTHRKEVETQQQIADAKAASLPKPFKIRMIDFLNSLDPKIVKLLATGQTRFSGVMLSSQFTDLQRLASEPGAAALITLRPGTVILGQPQGPSNAAEFDLNPSLLKP